jgi:hypothetical protein
VSLGVKFCISIVWSEKKSVKTKGGKVGESHAGGQVWIKKLKVKSIIKLINIKTKIKTKYTTPQLS